MPFGFLQDKGAASLDRIEGQVRTMLAHDRDEFELAMAALLGEREAAEVNGAVRAADRKVNALEREIRRELIVHTSVFGGVHTPAVLVYMSIVKDIERVGDYAKNLLDLALNGADFSQVPDAEQWRSLRSELAELMTEAGAAFTGGDTEHASRLLARGEELLTLFDDNVHALVKGDDMGAQPVPRALAHRYLKRVLAHLMNLLSAVVMPLHRLDFFDEDPEDRGG